MKEITRMRRVIDFLQDTWYPFWVVAIVVATILTTHSARELFLHAGVALVLIGLLSLLRLRT